jgi:hypothetical protein
MTAVLAIALLVGYSSQAIPVYFVARRLNAERTWFAFVPVLNWVLLARVGRCEPGTIVLLFIPLVQFVAWGYLWANACRRLDVPSLWGWAGAIPGVGQIYVPWLIALHVLFGERGAYLGSLVALCAVWLFGFSLHSNIFTVDLETLQRTGTWRVLGHKLDGLVNTFLVFAGASAAYLLCLHALRRGFPRSFTFAIAGSILAAACLLPLAPAASPDAGHLSADVRTLWLHGKYPARSENSPTFIDDPVTRQVDIFEDRPSGYGPLAYAIGGAPLPFVGDDFAANIFGQKVVAAVFLVLTALFAGFVARKLGQSPGLAAGFVGLNPLMLFEFPGDAHNDIIMAAFGMAALFFLIEPSWSRRGAGAGLALAAVLSKYAIALAGPVIVASWFPRWKLPTAVLMVGAGIAILLGFVFDVITGMPAAGPASEVIKTTPWGVAANALDASDTTRDRLVLSSYVLALLMGAAIIIRVPLDEPRDVIFAAALTIALFLFVAAPGYLPWYQVWFFPLVILTGRRWFIAGALAFSLAAFFPILSLGWETALKVDAGFSDPVQRAVATAWSAAIVAASITWWADRERFRRTSAVPRARARAQRSTRRRRA